MTDERGDEAPAATPQGFQPVEPGYKNVLRARLAVFWFPVVIGALLLERALTETNFSGLPSVLAPLLALISIVFAPQRVYARLGYRVGDRLLQVVRGWLFHTDTVVPFVRVQHLDVTRGPLDKMFGTASLVIHTAGTHNSIVTVPGLAPDRAGEIRDVIREHVRTDFE
jgi:membrane protein YdbS with pleckstrin-like domain